jgi:hypothetical protein
MYRLGTALQEQADIVLILHVDPDDDRVVTVEVAKTPRGSLGSCKLWVREAFHAVSRLSLLGLRSRGAPLFASLSEA